MLAAHEYWRWNKYDRGHGEPPESWCGGVSGPSVRNLSEAEMAAVLLPYGPGWGGEDKIKKELGDTYCSSEWEQPYYKSVREFWSDTIPRLLRLGKPAEVRIVFWFDN